jgi:hypothetical protein
MTTRGDDMKVWEQWKAKADENLERAIKAEQALEPSQRQLERLKVTSERQIERLEKIIVAACDDLKGRDELLADVVALINLRTGNQ